MGKLFTLPVLLVVWTKNMNRSSCLCEGGVNNSTTWKR